MDKGVEGFVLTAHRLIHVSRRGPRRRAIAALLLLTREPGQATIGNPESVRRNLVGALRLLRDNRTLPALMCLAAITEVFGFTHESVLPVFARDDLGIGPVGLGAMSASDRAAASSACSCF